MRDLDNGLSRSAPTIRLLARVPATDGEGDGPSPSREPSSPSPCPPIFFLHDHVSRWEPSWAAGNRPDTTQLNPGEETL